MEEFQSLGQATQDSSLEVRTDILNQLSEGLKSIGRKKNSLPLRYMALMVLYATDPEKEMVLKVFFVFVSFRFIEIFCRLKSI